MEYKEIEIEVKHLFVDGLYTMEHFIPKGASVLTHSHNFSHTSILASGSVILTVDNVPTHLIAPQVLRVEAHKHHSIFAEEDTVWMCQHITDETDVDKIEHLVIDTSY